MKSSFAAIAVVACASAMTTPVHALQYISGRVTMLEPTYMPAKIGLQLDTGNVACPAGKWLYWNASGPTGAQNAQAVYSTLLSALLSGKTVNFVINDGDTGCVGRFLHLVA